MTASQEQELRLNTELTREIHTLTTELHGHVLGARFPQDQPRLRISAPQDCRHPS